MKTFLLGFISDPVSKDGSSTRISALLCVLTACGVAVAAVVKSYDATGMITALLVGGAGSFFFRTKASAAE